ARTGITYASTWHRPAEGKPYLEKAFRLSQRLTPRDRLFIRAWYAVACEDYEAAERAYRQILSAYPLEVEVYHALGVLLEEDARYNDAIQMYQRGLAIEPDMPQLHNQLSSVYLELGQKNEAVERAQRYLALSGEPNAYDTLALAYYGAGDYAKARETYLEAIRRKPDFGLALVHLGNLYVQLGRYREALEQYREYIRLAPSYVERCRGHISCSWAYWKKGDLQNAEREAAAATRENHGQQPRDILPIEADRGAYALSDQLRHSLLDGSAARGPRKNQRIPFFLAGYIALRDHKTD